MLSPTLRAKQIKMDRIRQGLPVYDGGLGENPLPPPELLYKSLAKHAHQNEYTDCRGIEELSSLGEYLLVGNGLKPLILTLQLAFQKVYPSGTVVLLVPAWVSYIEQAKLIGVNYKLIHDISELDTIPAPHLVFFNNPNNPTGKVYAREEVDQITNTCKKYSSILFSDEIYKHLVHPGYKCGEVKYDKLIRGSSLSKAFSCGGYRFGWMSFTNLPLLYETCIAIASTTYSCPTTCLQYVAADLIRADMTKYFIRAREYFARAKNYCISQLADMHIHTRGMAAWYLLLDFDYYKDHLPETSDELADLLLQEGIIMVSGTAFGILKPLVLRYAYVRDVKECMHALKRFLLNISK